MLKANFSYVCWDVVNSLSVITAGWQASFSSSICCSRADAEADSRCIHQELEYCGFCAHKMLTFIKGLSSFLTFFVSLTGNWSLWAMLKFKKYIWTSEVVCQGSCNPGFTYKSQHTHTAGILAQVFFSRSIFKYFWSVRMMTHSYCPLFNWKVCYLVTLPYYEFK